jgi:hypothetical protein
VLTVLLLGAIGGVFNHYSHLRWVARGRDEFLAYEMKYQNRRFDRYMMHPHGVIYDVILTVGGLLTICVAYELLVAGFTAILPPNRVEN